MKGFAKEPNQVASIIPSMSPTIKAVLRHIDWEKCDVFVEYGPGVGTFCWPILEKLKSDATLVAIDTNEDFIRYLKKNIPDSRFIAVHDSATNVEEILEALNLGKANYIISGLPFSTLPEDVGPEIMQESANALRPGGAFIAYQYKKRVRDFMADQFRRIDEEYVFWNILPNHVFCGWKDLD